MDTMSNVISEISLEETGLQRARFMVVRGGYSLNKDGKQIAMRIGLHCPMCGAFYTQGQYMIKSGEYVLTQLDRATCCRQEHPTPKMFETVASIEAFFESCNKVPEGVRLRVVNISQLTIAYFDPVAVENQMSALRSRLH